MFVLTILPRQAFGFLPIMRSHTCFVCFQHTPYDFTPPGSRSTLTLGQRHAAPIQATDEETEPSAKLQEAAAEHPELREALLKMKAGEDRVIRFSVRVWWRGARHPATSAGLGQSNTTCWLPSH